MELSWSTFFLEIINFLVLLWVLKRFFYQPVLAVIARRRDQIEQTLSDARQREEGADRLRQRYEGRLTDWDKEKQQARETLGRELDGLRAQKMSALERELEQARQKMQNAEEQRQADTIHNIEVTALDQGARFAAQLLRQAAGPDLQNRLLTLLLTELGNLSAEHITDLRQHFEKDRESTTVTSAYPLLPDQQEQLRTVLEVIAGQSQPIRFEQDPDLVAGIRVVLGAWVLGANVRDELQGFREFGTHV